MDGYAAGYQAPARPAPARPVVSPRLAAGFLLVAVAICLTAEAVSAALPVTAMIWGSVALSLYCAGLLLITAAVVECDGLGLATWRIGSWSLLWGALAFGLATVTFADPQNGPAGEILPASLLRALWLIAVAMTMLAAGYCAGPRRLATRQVSRVTRGLSWRYSGEIRSPAVPWLLFGAGMAAQAAAAAVTGHLGYVGDAASGVTSASPYQQYLSIAGNLVPLAVAAAAVRAYRGGARGARLTLAVLFTGAILLGAIAGGKTSFIVAILAVAIPRAVVRRRVPWGGLIAAVLFFLLLVIPFNQAYRESARGTVTLSTGQAIAAAPADLRQVISSDLTPAVLLTSAEYLAQRIRTIDSPAIIMQRTPSQIPYGGPAELAEAPLLDVIPRILWPGKPILAVGYQVSQEYYELPPSVYTSSTITPEGDLYRHGGWVPLIAGMFIFGCGIRILDDVSDLRQGSHAMLFTILLFPDIVQSGDDWSTMLAGIPGLVILWLAMVSFSFARNPASLPPGSSTPRRRGDRALAQHRPRAGAGR
jgi:hypothetical protein